ncbi:MAG: hypothetical protein MUE42_06105 [Opitutaceae bacterium]|jgi:ABC-type molybdate transport system ATPase subunit|nr:hypothetical protein [Opitutaceae bacterium]
MERPISGGGGPVIYVPHHADEIVALGDEVVCLERGAATRRGRPDEVFVPQKPRYGLAPERA